MNGKRRLKSVGCLTTLASVLLMGCDGGTPNGAGDDPLPSGIPEPLAGAARTDDERAPTQAPGASTSPVTQTPGAVAPRTDGAQGDETTADGRPMPSGEAARAVLEPTAGNSAHGTVVFAEHDGALQVYATVSGLEPGPHGLHVHENGDCSADDASSAGGHFAPSSDEHGAPSDAPSEHHAGDLGNIDAPFGGTAVKEIEDQELTLEGEYGVVGRAVIVHAGEDDLETQPSGGSGEPIACGVVTLTNEQHG